MSNMYLLFDLSSRDIVHLALFDSGSIEHKKYSGMNRELLSSVDDFTNSALLIFIVPRISAKLGQFIEAP